MAKYSKIYYPQSYSEETKQNYGFRYNYKENVIEYLSKVDWEWDSKAQDFKEVHFKNWKVVDSVGLYLEDWQDAEDSETDTNYWVEQYNEDMKLEAQAQIDDFIL